MKWESGGEEGDREHTNGFPLATLSHYSIALHIAVE
jgi:hypothetical protein